VHTISVDSIKVNNKIYRHVIKTRTKTEDIEQKPINVDRNNKWWIEKENCVQQEKIVDRNITK